MSTYMYVYVQLTAICIVSSTTNLLTILIEHSIAYQLSTSIKNKINQLLANGVVASSIIIRGILFARHKIFGMEKLPIRASTHFIW